MIMTTFCFRRLPCTDIGHKKDNEAVKKEFHIVQDRKQKGKIPFVI